MHMTRTPCKTSAWRFTRNALIIFLTAGFMQPLYAAQRNAFIGPAQLFQAARQGKLATVRHCIERLGVNINSVDHHGKSVLFVAVHSAYATDHVVGYLLSKGASPYTVSELTIAAIQLDKVETCRLLLLCGNHAACQSDQSHLLRIAKRQYAKPAPCIETLKSRCEILSMVREHIAAEKFHSVECVQSDSHRFER